MIPLWRRAAPVALGLLGVFGVTVLLTLLLGPVAVTATPAESVLRGKEKADAVNATRQVLLAAVGGVALLTGAAFTIRTFYLSRRGQLTDRYTKAVALLASDRIAERLGGVYALQQLMNESARDHETVIAVLAGFIRERSAGSDTDHRDHAGDALDPGGRSGLRPATDVQAALSVLSRRPSRPESDFVDLELAHVCGANLDKADLAGASLWRAELVGASMLDIDLQNANLCWANLQKANLAGAILRRARLSGTDLRDAWLVGADLEGADLRGAQLQGARLGGANLHRARLDGARLQGADLVTDLFGDPAPIRGLDVDDMAGVTVDDATRLPGRLRIGHDTTAADKPG